jgi:hypothetical protein
LHLYVWVRALKKQFLISGSHQLGYKIKQIYINRMGSRRSCRLIL